MRVVMLFFAYIGGGKFDRFKAAGLAYLKRLDKQPAL